MTTEQAPNDRYRPDRNQISTAEWLGLIGILALCAAIRLPYWPIHRDLGDAINYSVGALQTHVAHPPGSVGYCVLLGWVNQIFHDIKNSILIVSFSAAMIAIAVCYLAARVMGMRAIAAAAAALLYGLSINTLKASLLGAPHILEGLCSLAFGGLVWSAIAGRKQSHALWATAVFALSGAFRPTTSLLLFPLWLLMLYRTRDGGFAVTAKRWLLHLLVAVPLIAIWSWGNQHYMSVNGYGGRTYQDQVMASTPYEFDNLATTASTEAGTPRLTFHMPGAELLAWVETKTGLRLMPHVPGWPKPSLRRAGRLILMQTLKQGWFLLLAAPAIAGVPILLVKRSKNGRSNHRALNLFFAIWIYPSILFFIFGHLGTMTYLQVYLGAVCLWLANVLLGSSKEPAQSAGTYRLAGLTVAGCLLFNVAFLTLTRPFQVGTGVRRSLDLVLLQFDGYSIRHNFATARRTENTKNADEVVGPEHDYVSARTDAEFLAAARKNHYQYMLENPTPISHENGKLPSTVNSPAS